MDFKKIGIYPFNSDMFGDWEFMAAEIINIQIENENYTEVSKVSNSTTDTNTPPKASNCYKNIEKETEHIKPECSKRKIQTSVVEKTAFKNVTPKNVLPIP